MVLEQEHQYESLLTKVGIKLGSENPSTHDSGNSVNTIKRLISLQRFLSHTDGMEL